MDHFFIISFWSQAKFAVTCSFSCLEITCTFQVKSLGSFICESHLWSNFTKNWRRNKNRTQQFHQWLLSCWHFCAGSGKLGFCFLSFLESAYAVGYEEGWMYSTSPVQNGLFHVNIAVTENPQCVNCHPQELVHLLFYID